MNAKVNKWTVIFMVVVVAITLAVIWPRHHDPPWNTVAAIQNAPACPHSLTNLTVSDAQWFAYSSTFTIGQSGMVRLMGVAHGLSGLTSDATVSGYIVPASIPQDLTDIGNSLSSCRVFTNGTTGSMYTLEVMPAGSYYIAAIGQGHSWDLFADTQ
jgi:hypothetical protein